MSNTDVVIERAPKKFLTRGKKRAIFYTLMMTLPIVQFLIFYVYLNLEAFSMAFQRYVQNPITKQFEIEFTMDNFGKVIDLMFSTAKFKLITNSFVLFVFHTGVGTLLVLTFSYYIYKKMRFAEFFRVVLFLPGIISAVVWSALFSFFLDPMYIELTGARLGFIENSDTKFTALIIYTLWVGFGGNILLYTGAMSGINESIVESASLDGANFFQEFFHITFPMIFNTFSTFIITAIAAIFTNQMGLYTFFGKNAPDFIQTVGYYMYYITLESDVWISETKAGKGILTYCELSAMGLLITAVTLPIVYAFRYLCRKFGPSVD